MRETVGMEDQLGGRRQDSTKTEPASHSLVVHGDTTCEKGEVNAPSHPASCAAMEKKVTDWIGERPGGGGGGGGLCPYSSWHHYSLSWFLPLP